jgi:hypothetical protein
VLLAARCSLAAAQFTASGCRHHPAANCSVSVAVSLTSPWRLAPAGR